MIGVKRSTGRRTLRIRLFDIPLAVRAKALPVGPTNWIKRKSNDRVLHVMRA